MWESLVLKGDQQQQPRPQGFSLKKWVGKSPGDEVAAAVNLQSRNLLMDAASILNVYLRVTSAS